MSRESYIGEADVQLTFPDKSKVEFPAYIRFRNHCEESEKMDISLRSQMMIPRRWFEFQGQSVDREDRPIVFAPSSLDEVGQIVERYRRGAISFSPEEIVVLLSRIHF